MEMEMEKHRQAPKALPELQPLLLLFPFPFAARIGVGLFVFCVCICVCVCACVCVSVCRLGPIGRNSCASVAICIQYPYEGVRRGS